MKEISQEKFQQSSTELLSQLLELMGKDLGRKVKKEERHLYFAGYYLTIVEYIHGMKDCIETNNLIAVTPIFRSCLEAFLDLVNIQKYENYYFILLANHLNGKINRINSLSEDEDNPYSQYLDGIENIDKELNLLGQRKRDALDRSKDLREDLDNDYSVASKFILAVAENEYGGIYGIVSDECHNNLSTIERRHFNLEDEIFNLEIFSKDNFQKLIPQIITSIGIARTATKLRFEFLLGEDFQLNSDFKTLKENYINEVWR